MKHAKRLARREREPLFEVLAAFANMGDTPAEWRKFRLKNPNFFPATRAGHAPPGFRSLDEWFYTFSEEWARDFADSPIPLLPPLLWYRNRLRNVWARKDPHGYNLAVLLGREQEAKQIAKQHPDIQAEGIVRPLMIPGQMVTAALAQDASHGLPATHAVAQLLTGTGLARLSEDSALQGLPVGELVINGKAGTLTWQFGCDLQRGLYELMQERWRAKTCAQCGRYFVADKTARIVCSTACSGERRSGQKLKWWNRKGKEWRAKRQAKSKRSTKK